DGHLDIEEVRAETLERLKARFSDLVFTVFGLKQEESAGEDETVDELMELIIDIRKEARENKDWGTSDKIRDSLQEAGIQLKDSKDGTSWVKM
ncbi:MAG: cysteine--tRNA ligase, partial [Saprospiraceae bacterium]|nr:cysteine--tRNA ligase [Saprospiraceae bacterium]